MFLNREQMLQKEVLKIERVDLGNDDFTFVRQMTGRERDHFERSLLKEVKDRKGTITYKQSLEDFRAKLAVNVVCTEDGEAIFKPEDFVLLSQNMSAARLELIVNKAQELNKISESDKEAMVKNSETGQSEEDSFASAGSSDSPTPTIG